MKNFPSRKELLNHINTVSFAVNDIQLYLDTHPDDEEALAFFTNIKSSVSRRWKNMQHVMVLSPLTVRTNHAGTAGTGSTSHGHGRKEDADLCGIMKNVFSFR